MQDVRTRLSISVDRGMKPRCEVQYWLEKADQTTNHYLSKIKPETEGLIQLNFFRRCFPWNYTRGKSLLLEMESIRQKVDQLVASGRFDVVGDPMPLNMVNLLPAEETVGLKRETDLVWSFLEEGRSVVVGLYGIGGAGKTALLKNINNAGEEKSKLFDVVIWVLVGKHVSVTDIQDSILRRLRFADGTFLSSDEKASAIFTLLMKKRYLLLLDDVWDRIDLTAIGIPVANPQNNSSKIVFTTRSMDVCRCMEADEVIKMNLLSEHEAWALFSKNVGRDILDSHTQIYEFARQVARLCGGLPVALILVARSMASKKTREEWQHARNTLRYSSNKYTSFEKLISVMEDSYNCLSTDVAKRCFLHCSLFPPEYSIDKNEVIRYWIGEGFLEGYGDKGQARNMGFAVLGELVSASLLEDEVTSVRMHRVTHDMALWIASDYGKKKGKFFVQAGSELVKIPASLNWEEAEKVSLMDNFINDLEIKDSKDTTRPPSCPNLSTLILSRNRFTFISDAFFSSMPSLRVLDLSWCKIERLPASVADLVTLHLLNLSHTTVSELPDSIRKLVNLEVLDLSYMGSLKAFPLGVIPELGKLKALNTVNDGTTGLTKEDEKSSLSTIRFLEELEFTFSLDKFGLCIRSEQALNKVRTCTSVQRCTRHLSLLYCEGLISFALSSLQYMTYLDTLEIHLCHDLERFELIHLVPQEEVSFSNLQHLRISYCWSLKELNWLAFVPNLESLEIDSCVELCEIIAVGENEASFETFSRLKRLQLSRLPNLISISSIVLGFNFLEEVTVTACSNLKKLPFDKKSAMRTLKWIRGSTVWWDSLEWEDADAECAFGSYFCEIDL